MGAAAADTGRSADAADLRHPHRHARALARSDDHATCAPATCARTASPTATSASLTEYFDYFKEPNGDEWFTVTTIVRDPQYLNGPFITSSDFKKEPDGSKWRPTPCAAR